MVSTDGRIKSLITNKILKGNGNNGYLSVELFKNGISKRLLIHRIVAETFILNPLNLPIVNHKDENKHNNCVDNLEWCDQKYNANYGNAQLKKVQNRKITDNVRNAARVNALTRCICVLQFSKNGVFIKKYKSAMEAHRELNINPSHITETCKNKRKSAGGYVWRYE